MIKCVPHKEKCKVEKASCFQNWKLNSGVIPIHTARGRNAQQMCLCFPIGKLRAGQGCVLHSAVVYLNLYQLILYFCVCHRLTLACPPCTAVRSMCRSHRGLFRITVMLQACICPVVTAVFCLRPDIHNSHVNKILKFTRDHLEQYSLVSSTVVPFVLKMKVSGHLHHRSDHPGRLGMTSLVPCLPQECPQPARKASPPVGAVVFLLRQVALFYLVHRRSPRSFCPEAPVPEALPHFRAPVACPGTLPWSGSAGTHQPRALLSSLFWCQLQPLSNNRGELMKDSHTVGIQEGGTSS